MNKNFVIGQYVKGDSYIYKIDPRVKIISILILMVSVFFLKSIVAILLFMAFVILILLTARISVIKAIKGIRPLLLLMIFIFFIQILINMNGPIVLDKEMTLSLLSIGIAVLLVLAYFMLLRYIKTKIILLFIILFLIYLSFRFVPGIPNIIKLFNFRVYKDGLMTSLYVLIRLVSIVLLSTILTISTTPSDLTLAFEWIFRPLKIFKINSEEIALIFTIALRYIPTIRDEAFKIMDAQASRGVDFKESIFFKKIKQIVSLLVPMFVISFERSDELADAMLSRNFVPGRPKTHYHQLMFRFSDLLVVIFSLLILGGSICIYILL